MSATPRPAPQSARRGRRGWRRSPRARAGRAARSSRAARVDARPSPAGSRSSRRCRVGVDRARQAHADAEHAAAVDARLLERELDELAAASRPSLGAWSTSQRRASARRARYGEVGDRHRDVAWPKSMPTDGAGAAVEGDQHGRPAALAPGAPSVVGALGDEAVACEVGRPGVETVVRDSPVARASSARLATPRCASASMTRRRLASRSDLSDDPAVVPIPARDPPRRRAYCQDFVETKRQYVRLLFDGT